MAKKHSRIKKHPDGFVQTDYVEPGSQDHAMGVLGLEPAAKSDAIQMTDKKGRAWRLMDETMFGPQVTERYLREVLRQKISELDAEPVEIQSEDPLAPGYCPPMDTRYFLVPGLDGTLIDSRTGKVYEGS